MTQSIFGTTYLVNPYSLYTMVSMKPLLHQHQLSLLQALVQPHQSVLCLLVGQMYNSLTADDAGPIDTGQ